MLRLFIIMLLTTVTALGGELIKIDNLIFEEVPIKREFKDYKVGRVLDGDKRYIGLYGIINKDNQLITKPNNMLVSIQKDYVYLVDINYKEGILSKDGKWIGKMGEFKYKNKESQMYTELGDKKSDKYLIIYKVENKKYKYGYLNFDGEVQVPMIYDDVRDFSEGFALVRKGNRWGYINEEGKPITEFKFLDGRPFKNGEAYVRENSSRYYIDINGEKKVFKSFCSSIKNIVVDFLYDTRRKVGSIWNSNIKEKKSIDL